MGFVGPRPRRGVGLIERIPVAMKKLLLRMLLSIVVGVTIGSLAAIVLDASPVFGAIISSLIAASVFTVRSS